MTCVNSKTSTCAPDARGCTTSIASVPALVVGNEKSDEFFGIVYSFETMPAIVYHIGIHDMDDHDEIYKQFVIKSQLMVLKQCCASADIYLGMHATPDQVRMILRLASECELKVTDTMTYEHDIWEVPTVEWLQNTIAPKYDSKDIISYLHAKGITHHDDQSRNYLMDHHFVQYEQNLEQMRNSEHLDAAVCCAHTDNAMTYACFWLSFWTAKVGYVLSLPPPDRGAGRWGSESFLKLKLGRFCALDGRICVSNKPNDVHQVPFQYMNREGWFPSSTLIDILEKLVVDSKGVFDEYAKSAPGVAGRNSKREGGGVSKDVYIHVIYGSIIAALAVTLCIVSLKWKRLQIKSE